MQRKTIEKVVKSKMEEWLLTISDESLRKDVRNNILVSGGSIASLFLNIEVNDYDVYIKDMSVLKRLVHYYVDPHKLEVFDGRYKSARLESVGDGYSQRANCIDALKADQIKIFTPSSGYKVSVIDSTDEGVTKKYTPLFFSPNAISLSDDLQIVCRFHGNAEQIHKTFDFMHATNYFTFDEGLVTNLKAMESLLTKQLMYQGSLYPLTTIIRIKKFLGRGWDINAGEQLKVMFQISELNLKDPAVLDDQLIGVDVAYFATLIEILQNKQSKDPNFVLTSSYLNTIIDKVFNEAE